MDILKKTWVRIIVSLLAGGMASETLHVLTADDVNDRSGRNFDALVMPVAVIVFFVLTWLVNRQQLKK